MDYVKGAQQSPKCAGSLLLKIRFVDYLKKWHKDATA
jgi:hypothetical protein